MTLIIVGILLIGYFLIATERINRLNKSSVAMFLGVVGWILYMLDANGYVRSMHGAEYNSFLAGRTANGNMLTEFVANHVFMDYVTSACKIILFIIATSSIIEILYQNDVFRFMRSWMRTRKTKTLLWSVSLVTFLLSANIDNLTSAVIMIVLLRQLIVQERQRMYFSCVILMAANAGGCFTAIGDLTSLILWNKEAITPSSYAGHLFLPCLTALVVTTYLASRKLPEHVQIQSALGAYRGDDCYLNVWQRIVLMILGIGGLWAIPTFHSVTKLPPFVGALLIMSLLWVMVEIFTHKRAQLQVAQRQLPMNLQTSDTSQILFFLGISLAVGAVLETGALQWFANFCDKEIHSVYILSAIFGFISSVFDNIPLMLVSSSMYDVAPDVVRGFSEAFVQNGTYWNLIPFCTCMGGTLLTIGSVAGFAVAAMERIPFWWYIRRFSWMVLLGWGFGVLVYYLQNIL